MCVDIVPTVVVALVNRCAGIPVHLDARLHVHAMDNKKIWKEALSKCMKEYG